MARKDEFRRRRLSSKQQHIDAALDGGSEVPVIAGPANELGFSALRFVPMTLPEINYASIDTSLKFLGKTISAPFMIAPMTGGLKRGGELNKIMATSAEALQIPFGVGSQRVALEVGRRARDFQVRRFAPTIPIFANLGAIQLVRGYSADDAQRAVDMVEGDALFLHMNAMQEVIQEDGDTDWRGVLRAIASLCASFKKRGGVPVFVREVGFGVPVDQARRLIDAGVQGIDCAGRGGTSWTLLEGRVATSSCHQSLGSMFSAWGLTTPESILSVRKVSKRIPVIASGGIRSGLDVAKAVALGATLASMGAPVIRAAAEGGSRAVTSLLETTQKALKVAMFGVGAASLAAFRKHPRLKPFASSLNPF
ncbi:MAG: type 2 isopentenyl-diphosphate Delta-isomerase [Deltaproteobacteria bacterium]|nr:type 2 isopentenyl-diphosphate Delta-isomerase [Deltaproteobacteria bacterium]